MPMTVGAKLLADYPVGRWGACSRELRSRTDGRREQPEARARPSARQHMRA